MNHTSVAIYILGDYSLKHQVVLPWQKFACFHLVSVYCNGLVMDLKQTNNAQNDIYLKPRYIFSVHKIAFLYYIYTIKYFLLFCYQYPFSKGYTFHNNNSKTTLKLTSLRIFTILYLCCFYYCKLDMKILFCALFLPAIYLEVSIEHHEFVKCFPWRQGMK